jgi:hypothetical protein
VAKRVDDLLQPPLVSLVASWRVELGLPHGLIDETETAGNIAKPVFL